MKPRIDYKLVGKQLSTMTEIQSIGRAFSRMVNRNLILSHFCTLDNLVYNMLTLSSLLGLFHMIEVQESWSQGQLGFRQFCVNVHLASFDLGLQVQAYCSA